MLGLCRVRIVPIKVILAFQFFYTLTFCLVLQSFLSTHYNFLIVYFLIACSIYICAAQPLTCNCANSQLCVVCSNFVYWHLPQLKYKNPQVQMVTVKMMTPTPWIKIYFGIYTSGVGLLITWSTDRTDNSPITHRMRLYQGELARPRRSRGISLAQHVTYLHMFLLSDQIVLETVNDDAVTVSSSRLFHKFITRLEKKCLSSVWKLFFFNFTE